MQMLGLVFTVATLIAVGLALAAPNASLGQLATLAAVVCEVLALLFFYRDRKSNSL